MSILDGIARYLAGVGVGQYDPTGAVMGDDWSIWLDQLPQAPDRAISLAIYAPATPGVVDTLNPWAEVRMQARARGAADPRESRAKLAAVYGELHGLGTVELPGGVWLQLAAAIQPEPYALGPDQSGRHEHVINFDISYDQPTRHRPAL